MIYRENGSTNVGEKLKLDEGRLRNEDLCKRIKHWPTMNFEEDLDRNSKRDNYAFQVNLKINIHLMSSKPKKKR